MITARSVSSARARYRFPREVLTMAVRWYLPFSLSYCDIEELPVVPRVADYRALGPQ